MFSKLDTYLFNAVNHGLANGLFDHVMPFITDRLYLILLPVLLWVFARDYKKALLAIALSVFSLIISDSIVHVLKDVVGRPRPFLVLEDARVLVGKGRAFSMPSGHAANSFAVVIPSILFFGGLVRPVLMLGAITVAFSRIYIGVHYPSDVLAGACIGIFSAILVISLYRWTSKKSEEGSFMSVLLMILAVISVFRIYYIFTGPLELSPEEAYYWELSRRLDVSYLTNGPLIAYVISAGNFLFPGTVFGVRIGAVILSASSAFVLFMLVRRMFDDRTALYAAILSQFLPLVSVFGFLMSTVSIFILFWIVSLYIVWEISERIAGGEKTKWYWLLLGISVGMGMLSHSSMVLFYPLTFIFMLSDGRLRKILSRPYPYMSVIVSLMLFSPVIIWNAGHNWIALKLVLQHYLLDRGFEMSAVNFLRSIGLPFFMITPVLFILVWGSVFKMREGIKGKFMFCFSVPLFASALVASFFWEIGVNMMIAPCITGLIAFSYLYLKGFDLLRVGTRSLVILGLAIAVVVTALSHYPEELRLPPGKDPSIHFKGWEKLGDTVSQLITGMDDKGKYFIVADDCMVSSELAFYVKGNPVTFCVNREDELSQYDLWPGFDDMVNYNAIIVVMNGSELPEGLKDFSECDSRAYDIQERRKKLREVTVFDCYDHKGLKNAEKL